MSLSFLINSIIGLFLVLIGWIIYKHKAVFLLTTYDLRKKYDKDGLAYFAGINTIIIGFLYIIINSAVYIFPVKDKHYYSGMIFGLFLVVYLIRIVTGTKKFQIDNENDSYFNLSNSKKRFINAITILSIFIPIIVFIFFASHNEYR